MRSDVRSFFLGSELLEYEVLRPLAHIRGGWDLYIDPGTGRYEDEEDTFAWLLNYLIDELSRAATVDEYHHSEDRLAYDVQKMLKWKIRKKGNTWVNSSGTRLAPSDYILTLQQGGFGLEGAQNLLDSAAGRVVAAIRHGQVHFDDMERGHRVILAGVLTSILYHWEPYEGLLRQRAAKQAI